MGSSVVVVLLAGPMINIHVLLQLLVTLVKFSKLILTTVVVNIDMIIGFKKYTVYSVKYKYSTVKGTFLRAAWKMKLCVCLSTLLDISLFLFTCLQRLELNTGMFVMQIS